MHYFIIIIIILLSTPTRPQPPASTASHHSQQHNHRNHILTHCKTHHKPTKPNHNFNKTPPPATTDQQISTTRERNRSYSEPRWVRERSVSNRRNPAPPRSLLRSPRTTAKLHHRETTSRSARRRRS
jgi:hypothetical protein